MRDDRPSKASEAWRRAAGEAPAEQAIWERIDDEPGGTGSGLRGEAGAAVRRGRRPAPERAAPSARPDGGEDPIAREATATGVPRFAQRLAEASRAFERDRFTEARGLLRPLAQRAPGSAPVRELYGLTLYRLGQWAAATRELEAFAELTGSAEQHPVLADCARALKRWDRVEELWRELKSASPSAALVAEGRIVMAGALADQGRLSDAIALLEPAVARQPKKLREHHLRLLYALADLRERAGEVPAARSLFRRIRDVAPDFADVSDRLRALG